MSSENLYYLNSFSDKKVITWEEPLGNRALPWWVDILSHLHHCLKKEIKVELKGNALKKSPSDMDHSISKL